MARVRMSGEALAAVLAGNLPKGGALGTARVAGIQAAKRCSELIPMCHPLPLTYVDVECRIVEDKGWIEILSTVRCEARTGAEMEALTAAAVAALTVVDMAKSADPWMTIDGLTLLEKSGGKSGSVRRPLS
jgi:cyclic pyranopterin phosphate synthase